MSVLSADRLELSHHRNFAIPLLILLTGMGLRTVMLGRDVHFHPDEALYATFARRLAVHGDLLLSDAPLDKPPLLIDAVAGAFAVFGVREFAARLPSFFADVTTLAIAYSLARRLYGPRVAALAALIVALSPFDLTFSATAFVDSLLTLWLLLALWGAAFDRPRIAGIGVALAIATKQSALQFIPLVIALWLCCHAGISRRGYGRTFRRFVLPIVVGGLLLALWSAARAAPVDFWAMGAANNNPGRLIRADEIVPRSLQWLALLENVTGFAPALILSLIPALSLIRLKTRASLVDGLLVTYGSASLLIYWLVAFNIYDRYLLPFVAIIAVLMARGVEWLAGSRPRLHLMITGLLILSMLPAVLTTLAGKSSIGGDHGTYTGIDVLAGQINRLTAGYPVYEHWLGWELGYYLGDGSPAQIVWLPSPEALARSACTSGSRAYFVAPSQEAPAWLDALQEAGIAYQPVIRGPFELYVWACDL
ncbi:MAG TPA: glycosyltransferase family 39 protein [Aggregatilineales bacterium]|nr:glycosyltransferase family 39 protein [Aggregatilineales bacterium]